MLRGQVHGSTRHPHHKIEHLRNSIAQPLRQHPCLRRTAPARPCQRNATTADHVSYIASGPLLAACNIAPASIQANASKWIELGQQLSVQLGFNHDDLSEAQRLRVYHYYLPLYWWCMEQLHTHRQSGARTALVVGISAPQGCGKSTVVEQLELLFKHTGHAAASVSIDDFYLTYTHQSALAAANPTNKLLQYRGNAGTHDLELGVATLSQLKMLGYQADQPLQATVPRYDKSAYGGRGDRAPPSAWPSVTGPLDIVFFEGWMSGFHAVTPQAAQAVDPALVQVNEFLRGYQAAWDAMVDSWLVIRIGDPQWVFAWRKQAEDRMKAAGRPGMTDEQVADFVSRFMPAYHAYLPDLYARGPTTAASGRTLIIEVDQGRAPLAVQPPRVC